MDSQDENKQDDEFHYDREESMRKILQNAIRMQALYSGKRIKIIETSTLTN